MSEGRTRWDTHQLYRHYDILPPPIDYTMHPRLLLGVQESFPPTQAGLLDVLLFGIFYAQYGIRHMGAVVDTLVVHWREHREFLCERPQLAWTLLCSELTRVLSAEYEGELRHWFDPTRGTAIGTLALQGALNPVPGPVSEENDTSEEFSSAEEDPFQLECESDGGTRAQYGRGVEPTPR